MGIRERKAQLDARRDDAPNVRPVKSKAVAEVVQHQDSRTEARELISQLQQLKGTNSVDSEREDAEQLREELKRAREELASLSAEREDLGDRLQHPDIAPFVTAHRDSL